MANISIGDKAFATASNAEQGQRRRDPNRYVSGEHGCDRNQPLIISSQAKAKKKKASWGHGGEEAEWQPGGWVHGGGWARGSMEPEWHPGGSEPSHAGGHANLEAPDFCGVTHLSRLRLCEL